MYTHTTFTTAVLYVPIVKQIHSYIPADHSNLNAEVFTLAQKQALDLLRWGKQPATVYIVVKIFLNLHRLHINFTKFLYLIKGKFGHLKSFFKFLPFFQAFIMKSGMCLWQLFWTV